MALRHKLEDEIDSELKREENGYCDGGDIGSGTINMYFNVKDVGRAIKSINKSLQRKKLTDKAVIAQRIGEDIEVLQPNNYGRPFEY